MLLLYLPYPNTSRGLHLEAFIDSQILSEKNCVETCGLSQTLHELIIRHELAGDHIVGNPGQKM